MRVSFLLLGLCCFAGAVRAGEVERIIAVIEARERATGSFCAEFYETGGETGDRRMGPHFFAWSPDRSMYRGPKLGAPIPVLGWITGDRVERESIYYRDRTHSLWLHRETDPVALVWNGTRSRSSAPDFRSESGLFWRELPYSAYLRVRAVTVLGNESIDGDPCVKLLVQERGPGDPWPQVLWLSKAFGYFPRRLVDHRISTSGTLEPGDSELYIRGRHCFATERYRWDELRRRGDVWYPTRIRIESIGFDPDSRRLIEVVEGSARFGDEVTARDFELPGLYLLNDKITGDYLAVTPLGPITAAAAISAVVGMGALSLLWLIVRRRRAAS